MVSRKLISEIRQLHQIKHRNATGCFLAEGEKVVSELLTSELKIETLICTQAFSDQHNGLFRGAEVIITGEKDLERLSLLKTPNKVLAIARKPEAYQPTLETGGVTLMLDSIRDPGNMGTIIRTAEWFGVKEIICSDDCVEVWNPKVVQGAMGSLFRMRIGSGVLSSILKKSPHFSKMKIIAADLKGSPLKEQTEHGDKIVLVIGSESHGISPELATLSTERVRIPGNGAESLNAAVACGILLYALTK